MWCHWYCSSLPQATNEGHNGIVGHGMAAFPLPHIDKNVVRQVIRLERSKIVNEIICVELHDGCRNIGNDVGMSTFCPRSVDIVLTGHNVNLIVFYTDVRMA